MATEEETFDQISGEELFEGKEAEAPKEEPKAEETKPETEEAKETRERDEKGRFKAKEEETPEAEEEPEAEPETEEQPEPEEKQDHRVPLMELLNEREKRQEEQRRREQIEQQLWQIQQQLQQKEQPKPEPIDPFQDPEGWVNAQQQTTEQRLRAMEGNFSLRLAKAVHKELFDEAWTEMMQQSQSGNDSMRQQVLNSSDPGETLVSLYKQAKTFREVNGDPNSWLEAKKQEWLKDPEVQRQILELTRQTATQQSTQSKPQVKLPPSMNKAGSSGRPLDSSDMSDAALWDATR